MRLHAGSGFPDVGKGREHNLSVGCISVAFPANTFHTSFLVQEAPHKFTIAVLMEYIRSLNQFQIAVQVKYLHA